MPELKKEQFEAVMHDRGNILVSASAGSGKTFVMIERLIRLISEGKAGVKEILAVTFTEAAAADMKEKLKTALINKINSGDEKLASELAEVSAADISTLHSFCARLLRRYFFAAEIAPDFAVADEDKSDTLKKESMEKTFKEFYDGKNPDFAMLAARHRRKRSDEAFKKLILSMYEYCESETSPEEFSEKYVVNYSDAGFDRLKSEYKSYLDKTLGSLLSRAEKLSELCEKAKFEKGRVFTSRLAADINELKAGGLYEVKRFEEYKLPADFGRGLSADDTVLKNSALSVRSEFMSAIKRFSRHLTDEAHDREIFPRLGEHTRILSEVLKRFAENYAAAKREENVLDFADLEHFALRVLSDNTVLRSVKSGYKYIFVDEYQDINGVQEKIISLLSDDNLFMVGDVKQSIYGFRGCRPEIFAGKLGAMKARGEKTVLLNHNFRSASAVIDAANEIFSYSMTERYAGLDYKNTSMLVSGGVYPDDAVGRCELHLLKTDGTRRAEKETPRIYDIMEEIKKSRSTESAAVASLITEIINGEIQKEFYDPKEKKYKRVTFSDIAILSRNRNNKYISGLVSGLIKHGIPVVSEVKENVCDYPEIAVLVNALKLIDCFYQDIPLISTLLSPIGGFTEEDLSEAALYYSDNRDLSRGAGGFTDAFLYYTEKSGTALAARFSEFISYYEKIRFVADFTGASGALVRLTEDCGYENYILASRAGEAGARRLHGFMSVACSGERRYTVKEFLKKIDSASDAFYVAESAEEDAVRVMTIHSSKGLEFPVAIVCGLERRANTEDEREEVLADRDLGFAVRYYDDAARTVEETLLRGVMREKMRENRLREELRLFYVAVTRAQYSLHLTFEGKEDGRKAEFCGAERFLDYVPASLGVTEWNADSFAFTDMTRERRQVLIGSADEKTVARMRENFLYVYPFSCDTVLPLKGSVTKAVERNFQREYPVRVLFGEEDGTDAERGLIAHRILENYDFASSDFDGQIEKMISGGTISREEAGKVNLARIGRAVGGGAFDALDGYSLYREKQFMAEVPARAVFGTDSKETVLLQGVIDLLAVKDGEARIFDYKYSSLDAARLKRKYSLQLDLYAMAAEKTLGVKVVEKTLVNLYSGETVRCGDLANSRFEK